MASSAHERVYTGLLARWARHCAVHPWRVILTWVGVIVALGVLLGAGAGGTLRNEFKIPGSDAQKAVDLIEAKFPARQGAGMSVVFAAPEGQRLDTAERKAAVEKAVAVAAGFKPGADGQKDGIVSIETPFDPARFSQAGRIAYASAVWSNTGFDISRERVVDYEDAVRASLEGSDVTVAFNGEAEQAPPEQGASELIGILVALIILLVVFRTFVAAAIPILLAIVALATAFMLLFVLARFFAFNTITPILVSMIGLGVGIDYSLFIVTRFRQLLHEGLDPVEAAAGAAATAGRAVIFAGVTVAISITGLVTMGLDFVTKLGFGSALGVLTTVLIANSLLPSVLRLLGHRVDRLKVPFLKPLDESEAARERTGIARWGRWVTSHAKIVMPVTLIILLLLASPAIAVRLGAADEGTNSTQLTSRNAYDLLAEGFGPGFNGPIPVVIDTQGDATAGQKVAEAAKGQANVAFVAEPIPNEDGSVVIVNVVPKTSPQDAETSDLVNSLRELVPQALAGTGAIGYVSGSTAAFKDIGDQIMSRLPWFLLYIIGVTFVLLTMAFRSVVIALKAALTTILSAFVGFGVLVFVMQEGNLLGITGLDKTGPIETFVPPIAFAILFGLSMDYEVFLMSRIREEHVLGLNTRDAVEHGVAAIGRVIVAAALIMSSVFIAFMLAPDRISKEFGLLLAVAILVDALIVRMTLVPALLTLAGERSWYIPAWLNRVLPDLTIEAPAERVIDDVHHGHGAAASVGD